MEMTPTGFDIDFAFGEVAFLRPASQEDTQHGIDAWLGGVPFAWRRRRISVDKYGEVSIRHSRLNGADTEYDKLVDGRFRALVYVFQFTDAIVICRTEDIRHYLKGKQFIIQPNRDNATQACYLSLSLLPHLIVRMNDG
jgi:hypothetical protein